MLTKNPPDKRLSFIVKTYMANQPWVVWDTLGVIFNTIGIDEPERAIREAALDSVALPAGMTNKQFWMLLSGMFAHGQMLAALPDPKFFYESRKHPDFKGVYSYSDMVETPYYWGDPTWGRRRILLNAIPLLMSKEFADGLMNQPHDADFIFPWVAREISKLSKRTISQANKDIEENYSARDLWLEDYFDVLEELRKSANAIAAWASRKRVDINKVSLMDALGAAKDFQVKVAVPQGTIVKKFKSGWTVQELRGRGRLDPEGKKLQHCVGSYCSSVEFGNSQIYSLRDPDGVPYVTMEVDPKTNKFKQVFGEKNNKVGSEVFNDYVFREGQENDPPLSRDEVPEVVEAIKDMLEEFIDERSNGDLASLAMANINMTPRVEAAFRSGHFFSVSDMTLKSIDLSGLDLSKIGMESARFEDSNLSESKMDEVHAIGTTFLDCNMVGVDLMSSWLNNASFEGSDLTGATMSAVKASDASFRGATMTGVDMRFAYLFNAKFVHAYMRNANLSGASVRHANFEQADLSGADLSSVKDIGSARFVGAIFDESTRFPAEFDPVDAGMQFGGPASEEGQDFAQRERLMEAYRGPISWDDDEEPDYDDEDWDEGEDDEDDDEDW